MANAIQLNDLLELKLYAFSQGQYSINTLHYACVARAGDGEDDVGAGIKFQTTFSAAFRDLMSSAARYVGLTTQIIRPTRRPKIVNVVGAGDGTEDSDILPRQVAGLIRKLTNVASRHGRGRMYVPFPAESHNTATGFPENAYLTALGVFADLMDDTIQVGAGGDTVDLDPVVFDRASNTGLLITGVDVGQTWASCRRRSDTRGSDRPPF